MGSEPHPLVEAVHGTDAHRVVVVGGGFGGLRAARALRRAPVDVTLVDGRNFHLFQPLLYQVATGSLSPGEIAYPLRALFKHQSNVRVVMGTVEGFDLDRRRVTMEVAGGESEEVELPYDTLVVSAGAAHSYFGHDEWEGLAPGLKSIEDALELRRRILVAFEAAEVEPHPERRRAWLTFVVVGGGPTGVEMAGQIAEIARDTVRRDFRSIDPAGSRVLLVEGLDRILSAFHPRSSASAVRELGELGVTVITGRTVSGVDEGGVTIGPTSPEGAPERIPSRTVVWAAGVAASPLTHDLARASGTELDRSGRLRVGPDLTLPGHPEVFVIGDMVTLADQARGGRPLPGVAPVAMQEGDYVGRAIAARMEGRRPAPFRYRDKGNLATVGRSRAVAEIHGMRFSGFPAWLLWLGVHLVYLIGFQNRLLVLIRWAISFVTHGRGARLITGKDPEKGPGGSVPQGESRSMAQPPAPSGR